MSATRERDLQRLVSVLLHQLGTFTDTRTIERNIRRSGMGWALPTSADFYDDDDWLTVDQLAFELGYTQSAIRNWPTRYRLKPVKGRYRWGDVQDTINARNQRNHDGSDRIDDKVS